MTTHAMRDHGAPIDFGAIRHELGVPDDFPPEVLAEAVAASSGAIRRQASYLDRGDDRDIEFVTIDPPGSQDLDQAVHIERIDDGFRVRYAIADIVAFVEPDGPLDRESRTRAMTLYSPDTRTPLYPAVLSEGAASLLPDQDRPALLWTIDLDETGEPQQVALTRTQVRSRAQLAYPEVQRGANVGELHPSIALLPHVGALRLQAARRRHAIDLDMPGSEIVETSPGRWTLRRRALLPVERFNAQISLLTGMCAAQIMVDGGIGILRTLPTPDERQIAALRRATAAFGIPWPDDVPPGDVVSELDSSDPRQAAFIEDAISLLRGADYSAFDGEVPGAAVHAGIGARYAHVTAPLRRLVDRFGLEICLALQQGREPANRAAIAAVPEAMRGAAAVAGRLDHACTAAVSDFLLSRRLGEVLTGIVVQIDHERKRATILLDEPPVRVKAPADGFTEGSRAAVRLAKGDTGIVASLVR